MLKHSFLGSNTPLGFVGFFAEMMKDSKAIILKGGPGTGKSSLMKKVGAKAEEQNLPVEYCHCSSDPDSLDGVYIPSKNYVILDGTSPHALDAPLPVINEIVVNLADNADISSLIKHEQEIRAMIKIKKQNFAFAYNYLKAAGNVLNNIYNAELELLNYNHLYKLAEKIADRVKYQSSIHNRTYFANAVTPKGILSYLSETSDGTQIIKINCQSQAASKKLIEQIKLLLIQNNCAFDSLICPITPDSTQDIIIGDFLITAAPNIDSDEVYELPLSVPDFSEEIVLADKLIGKTIFHLQQARIQHLAVEQYYIEAMDFADINKKTNRIMNYIFG